MHDALLTVPFTRRSIIAAVASVLTVGTLASSAVGQGTQASFQGIGPGIQVNNVSGDGLVVVGSAGGSAILWTMAGGVVNLGSLDGGSSDTAQSASLNGDVIVGGVNSFPGYEAFRWTSVTGMVGLGSLTNPPNSAAFGVSADGSVVVGLTALMVGDPPASSNRAFRWTSGAGMVNLGLLSDHHSSIAHAVSADGSIVVGTSGGVTNQEAFRWTATNGMIGLGFLPGGTGNSEALGISANGQVVVGWSISTNIEAFRWSAGTGMVGLGDLPGGVLFSTAFDASSDGSVIVGFGHTGVPFTGTEAFIWDAARGMRNLKDVLVNDFGLNLTGWTLAQALAVSDDGRTIVGGGRNPAGQGEAWIARLPSPDTDGDGLLDDWEANGIPYTDSFGAEQRYVLDENGDGQSDSDSNHKDIWVEIDAMAGRAPTLADLQPVIEAFAIAPAVLVDNPDGQAGIRLHALIDETNLTLFAFPNGFSEFDQVKLTQTSGTTINGRFGTVAERTGPDAAAKREAKRQAFRYCIFADTHSGGTSSGRAELPGNDFMVTLGEWLTPGGTSQEKAGTFMHELGHTLGLGHGGRDAVSGADSIVYKPNYYSIMNYTWQTPEPWMAPNTWPLSPGRFGYSTFALLDLDEADLFECQGVAAPAGVLGSCPVPHNTHNSASKPVATDRSFMCCAIDWNNDNHVGCFVDAVAVDLNHLYDRNPASPGELLRGREDFSKLIYDFKTSPDFADGSHITAALVEEITFEEHQAVLASLPAFCLGDINLDRSVNIDDLLAVIGSWGPCPQGCLADIVPLPADGVVSIDDLLAVISAWGPCP